MLGDINYIKLLYNPRVNIVFTSGEAVRSLGERQLGCLILQLQGFVHSRSNCLNRQATQAMQYVALHNIMYIA